jgi:hypothetical protein
MIKPLPHDSPTKEHACLCARPPRIENLSFGENGGNKMDVLVSNNSGFRFWIVAIPCTRSVVFSIGRNSSLVSQAVVYMERVGPQCHPPGWCECCSFFLSCAECENSATRANYVIFMGQLVYFFFQVCSSWEIKSHRHAICKSVQQTVLRQVVCLALHFGKAQIFSFHPPFPGIVGV